jgi:transcriptional regulator with XRE-family HTH domain
MKEIFSFLKKVDLNQVSTLIAQSVQRHGKKSEVARQLGISSQLLGQYISGKHKPKADFYLKWKEVFKEDLLKQLERNVSHETKPNSMDNIINDALARALDNIGTSNLILARLLEESQKEIKNCVTTNTVHLTEVKADLKVVAAMQNAYHEYWAEHVPPKGQTPKQVMSEIHSKAFASLENKKKGSN